MIAPEFAAKRILRRLNITHPGDLRYLEEIAYTRGALVQYARLIGAEARISVVGEKAIITVSETVSNRHRKRFSIAHELGHFELHRRQRPQSNCSSEDLDSWSSKGSSHDMEQEANTFAAALLLPETFFSPRCDEEDPSLDHIAKLATLFDTSLTATALRYLAFTEATCAVIHCHDGRIDWVQGSASFKERGFFIDTGNLDPRSMAASLFKGKESTRPHQIGADVWLAPGTHQASAFVNEQSWLLHSYRGTLTLVWIEDEIEYPDDNISLWL